MKKFDVFITVLDVEHTTVMAESQEEAEAKVDRYMDNLLKNEIMDPVDLMRARVEVRPAEWNQLEDLE